MKAAYWQQGAALDYTAEDAVPNGSVVTLGTRIGIAAGDIPAGGTGAVHVEGVFWMRKAAGDALEMGAAVYYDKAADVITASTESSGPAVQSDGQEEGAGTGKTEKNVPAGYAAAPAAANDGYVLVKLLG